MSMFVLRGFAVVILFAVTPAIGFVQAGVELTVPSPEPRTFVVALDELELDWTGAHNRDANSPDVTVLSISNVTTLARLAQLLADQESANPGTRGRVVLYEPGKPRTVANRRLLTSDVAILVSEGMTAAELTGTADLTQIRAVPGVANAFVGRAASPLAAIDVARAFASVPGVKSAYPLINRTPVSR